MSRAKKARTQRRSPNQPSSANDNSQQLQKAMNWVIHQQSFKDLDFHGNTSWQPADLVVLTLLWIWSREDKLTAAFDEARSQACGLYGKAALTSAGTPDHRVTTTPTNRIATTTDAKPLNNPSAEADGKKRFP